MQPLSVGLGGLLRCLRSAGPTAWQPRIHSSWILWNADQTQEVGDRDNRNPGRCFECEQMPLVAGHEVISPRCDGAFDEHLIIRIGGGGWPRKRKIQMASLLDGAEPVCGLLRWVTGSEAIDDFFVFREYGMADGKIVFPKHPRFESVGRLSTPVRRAGDDVGIQDDNHRRRARTSRTTCSTAASSSAAGLGWERLRSSRVAHCSCVRGWSFRRTMEPL